jgi:hypothetical protein
MYPSTARWVLDFLHSQAPLGDSHKPGPLLGYQFANAISAAAYYRCN